jgi:hypothetical protein
MLVVAAVGDDDSYSCLTTPAESPHILSVGATSASNMPLKDSNYGGECRGWLLLGQCLLKQIAHVSHFVCT